ncbi:hypothetical protein P692DRAFT_201808405 [Suillus brevipes Sb2]|nr:hypothetical protein P692DRAFT_201808405 [Suillus brevipes Sb2]
MSLYSGSNALLQPLQIPVKTGPIDYNSVNGLQKEDYPLINFWTHDDFKKWDNAADAQGDQQGSLPFLEHTNEDPVMPSEQHAIIKTFRAVWFGLQQRGIAPISWGRAIPDARNALYKEVSRIHPELALCDKYWKIEHVARDRYPSWASTHLKEGDLSSTDPEEKKPRVKQQKRKARMIESTDSTRSECDSKRANIVDTPDSEARESEPPDLSSSNIESLDPPSSKSNSSKPTILPPLSLSPKPQMNNPEQQPVHNDLPTPAPAETPAVNTNSAIVTSVVAPATPAAPSADDTIAPCAKTASLPASAVTPIDACVTSSISESVNVASQSKPGPTSKNFRPATTKNGRNLCAHRWLKQVAPNGYSRDFKLYWDSLGKDCQEKYETDAKKLISDGIWTGSTVEVIGQWPQHQAGGAGTSASAGEGPARYQRDIQLYSDLWDYI